MKERVRIGVVGLGFMGMTHLQAIEKVPEAELAAVCSADERKLSGDLSMVSGNLGTERADFDFSGVARFKDSAEMFRSPEVDAVVLCVPTDLHCRMAVEALAAGKHVLVEKPMALTLPQCDTMRSAAREAGRVLMVGQVLRFWPEYVAARQTVSSGKLGKVIHAAFSRFCGVPPWSGWLHDAERSGGGIFDLLIHDFDFTLYLLGAPVGVQARGVHDGETGLDLISAEVRFEGMTADVSGGWYPGAVPFSAAFQIAGSEGTLDFDTRSGKLHFYPVRGDARHLPVSGDAFAAEMAEFVRCSRKAETSPICPPEQSSLAVSLTLAAVESRGTRDVYTRMRGASESGAFVREVRAS